MAGIALVITMKLCLNHIYFFNYALKYTNPEHRCVELFECECFLFFFYLSLFAVFTGRVSIPRKCEAVAEAAHPIIPRGVVSSSSFFTSSFSSSFLLLPPSHSSTSFIYSFFRFAGIRVGEYKLVTGPVGSYDDWYPPWQLPHDDLDLHVDRFHSKAHHEAMSAQGKNINGDKEEEVISVQDQNSYGNDDREKEEVQTVDKSGEDNTLKFVGEDAVIQSLHQKNPDSKGSGYDSTRKIQEQEQQQQQQKRPQRQNIKGTPVTVSCGPKPQNASTNCQPQKAPCLYHIPSDPCEFNNIADAHPDIVAKLFARLTEYMYSMVPPGNKPIDDRGNPKYHNGTWVPWIII